MKNQNKPKCLFICKESVTSYGISYGLSNSARFVAETLNEEGYPSKVVRAIDNNCIDKLVTEFKADIVFIEALWVVPEKFLELKKLHPKVKWVVRIHSKTPFLAQEGMAINWIKKYDKLGVHIAPNSMELHENLEALGIDNIYLPNLYIQNKCRTASKTDRDLCSRDYINIGCFGAIRPLKNHLLQAMAAMTFAEDYNLKLRFYINVNRVENRGEEVLRNIRALFKDTRHELVEVPWLNHGEFLHMIQENIDIGMQVSLTESFNIVTADFVSSYVPILVSNDISWMPRESRCISTETTSILYTLEEIYLELVNHENQCRAHARTQNNVRALNDYNKLSTNFWLKFLKS